MKLMEFKIGLCLWIRVQSLPRSGVDGSGGGGGRPDHGKLLVSGVAPVEGLLVVFGSGVGAEYFHGGCVFCNIVLNRNQRLPRLS